MSLFGSIFSGLSNNANRVRQRKAVLKFEQEFGGEDDDFFAWADSLNEHLQETGLSRSTIVQGEIPPNGGNRPEYNIFESFGMVTEEMVLADRERLLVEFGASRAAEQANIANGDPIGHHLSIAKTQERGWISELINNTISPGTKATLKPYRQQIRNDGLVKLYYLFDEFASTSNEAVILAENNLLSEKLRMKNFKYNVREWTRHIRDNVRLIQANGDEIGRQTRIVVHEQLAKYPNDDFKRIFGKYYDEWRAKAGQGWTITLTQLLAKADKEYRRCQKRSESDTITEEEPDVLLTQTELMAKSQTELMAKLTAFQNKFETLEEKLAEYKNQKQAGGPQNRANWKKKAPESGESEQQQRNGRTWYWCNVCKRWTPHHGTAQHRPKNGNTNNNQPTSNVADLDFP